MKALAHLFSRSASFRTQILTIFTLGIFAMALIASLTNAWLANRQTRELMVTEGRSIAANLAQNSILALLYGSGENARAAADATLSFPDVIHLRLWDLEGQTLLSAGHGLDIEFPRDISRTMKGSQLFRDRADSWHFLAPVYSHRSDANRTGEELLYEGSAPRSELLGYAYVVMGKDSLRRLQTGILLNNVVSIFLIALLLTAALNVVIRRITRPIGKLAETMQQAENTETHVYAELSGTQEIARMAAAFNGMMEALEDRDRQLREQNETLESKVRLRTQELVQARDAALAASKHKSEFLANMSHELRTPIQAMIGYAEVLSEEMDLEGRDEVVTDLRAIVSNARHLLTMINDILDLAKIEAGRMELKRQSVQLAELAERASKTILPLMRQNGNRFGVELEGEEEPVMADADKLLQVMLNLLGNAAKFTQEGDVKLRLVRSDGQLSISVVDTGVGIPQEMQEQIFEEFRQVDGSTTRKFEGTGLGLAITRRLVSLMGGTIAVTSTPGEGATFTITVPV